MHTEPSEPGSWLHGWQKPAARVLNKSSLPGGRACRRVVASHPHGRGHTAPSDGYASRPPATPSLAATLDVGPLRWTWRARLPSRGGPQMTGADSTSSYVARRGTLPRCDSFAAEGRRAPATGLIRSGLGCHRRCEAAQTTVLPLNWPARARNASSSWLRRSADDEAHDLVRSLAQQQRSLHAPRALRAAARTGWEHRWWGQHGCALQRALAWTLLGGCWRAPAQPTGDERTPLGWVLDLAEAKQPSLQVALAARPAVG